MKKILLLITFILPIAMQAQIPPDHTYGTIFNTLDGNILDAGFYSDKLLVLTPYRALEVNPNTKELLKVIDYEDYLFSKNMIISKDGKKCFTTGLRVIDIDTGEKTIIDSNTAYYGDMIRISRDEAYIAVKRPPTAILRNSIYVFDIAGKELLTSIEDKPKILDFQFNNNNELQVFRFNNSVTYHDIHTGDIIRQDTLPGQFVSSNKEKNLFVIMNSSKNYYLFDAINWNILHQIDIDSFNEFVFTPDSKHVIFISKDSFSFWNIIDAKMEGKFTCPEKIESFVEVSHDYLLFMYTDEDIVSNYRERLIMFNIDEQEFQYPFVADYEFSAFNVSDDNDIFLFENPLDEANLKSLDKNTKKENWRLKLTKKLGLSLSLPFNTEYSIIKQKDGFLYMNLTKTAQHDSTYILVVNKKTGIEENLIGPFKNVITCLEFWNDKLIIGLGNGKEDGGIIIWNLSENKSEKFIKLNDDYVANMYLDESNGKIITHFFLWFHEIDLNTFNVKKYFVGSNDLESYFHKSIFSKNGEEFVVATQYGNINDRLVKTDILAKTTTFKDSLGAFCMELSDDGSRLYLGYTGKILELDYETLEIINEYGNYPMSFYHGDTNRLPHFNDIDIHGDKLYGITSDGCLVEYTLRPASVPRYISDDNSDVLVYPNPVSSGGKLSIDIKNENYTITGAELLDLTSNIIQRYETTPGGRQSINLAGIAPGVYFLKLSTNKGIIVKKLVVM